MVIRTASRNDLEMCGGIYSAAFSAPPYSEDWTPEDAADMLGEVLQRDPDSCWVAEVDGQVVGFAFCTRFGRFRATVQEFALAPAFQRKGLGTALMGHALEQFRARGVRAVDLVVNRQAPAFGFYHKFSFRQPQRYVLMAKWL